MENKEKSVLSALITALMHIAGLLRVILVAFLFGSSQFSDLLSFTFSFSNQARKKIEDGSGNLALLRLSDEDSSRPLFLILFHITFLCISLLISEPLFSFLFGFSHFNLELYPLGLSLFKSFFIFLALFSLSNNFNSYLIRYGKKALSSFLLAIPSIFSIIFLTLFSKKFGILAFSRGLIGGTFIFLILSFSLACHFGMKVSFSLNFNNIFFKSYFTSSLIILLSVYEVLPLFAASSLIEKGSIYFSNSYTIAVLPYSMLLELFTLLSYPEIARCKKSEREEKYIKSFSLFSFLALAISLLLFSFSKEISTFLFLSAKYREEDVALTANILSILSLAILPLSLFSLFQRFMFLDLDNRGPIMSTAFKIFISYLLLFIIPRSIYKSSLIFILSSILSLLFSFFLIKGIKLSKFSYTFLKSAIASSPIIVLSAIKCFFSFDQIIKGRVLLLTLSLLTGIAAFLCSVLLYSKLRPRSS